MTERICSEPDCGGSVHGLGLCKRHHARANYHANREARRAQQATYRVANRQAARDRAAQWRANNPDRARANVQRWYAEHRADVLAYRRQYRLEHLDEVLAHNRARRAREKGAVVRDLTAAQWRAIKTLFGHRCAYCARQMRRLTQDHVIPLSKGGDHTEANIVPACQSCNSRKGDRVAPPFHPMFRHLE